MQEMTFAQRVDAAIKAAQEKTEFMLSRAEEEEALAPLVRDLQSMSVGDVAEYIGASHRGAGTYDALATRLYLNMKGNPFTKEPA